MRLLQLVRVLPFLVLLLMTPIYLGVVYLQKQVKTYQEAHPAPTPLPTRPANGCPVVLKDILFVHVEPVTRVWAGPAGHNRLKDHVEVHMRYIPLSASDRGTGYRTAGYLTDARGRTYQDSETQFDPAKRYVYIQGPPMPSLEIDGRDRFDVTVNYYVNLHKLPADAGTITFHGDISDGKNPSLKVQTVVREVPGWHRPRSDTLSLRSWKLTNEQNGPLVQLTLAYKGTKLLSTQVMDAPGNTYGSFPFWGAGLENYGLGFKRQNSPPGKLRLITHWSQRLEDPAGTGFWKDAKTRNMRVNVVRSVFESETRLCRVSYRIFPGNLPDKGALLLAAEIGVEGDGFLPIKIPVRNAAGQWQTGNRTGNH